MSNCVSSGEVSRAAGERSREETGVRLPHAVWTIRAKVSTGTRLGTCTKGA